MRCTLMDFSDIGCPSRFVNRFLHAQYVIGLALMFMTAERLREAPG